MATINADLVKELRELTGGGLLECKKALETTNGDLATAEKYMRKAGKAKADKKATRIAAEGVIALAATRDDKFAVMVEVNCETDFVAKDISFSRFAETIAAIALAGKVSDIASLMTLPINSETSKTVADLREELVAKIGENITIRRLARMVATDSGTIGYYVHGGRIGALVKLSTYDKVLGKDLAMHIVASRPIAIRVTDISPNIIAQEKEIFMAQAQESGKPKEIIEKMVNGRIQKMAESLALMTQPFVKNSEMRIADLVKYSQSEVLEFIRFEVGEGIEKEKSDFAAEVMAQVKEKK